MHRLEGFVQFYLGTWLHRRRDGPSHEGGQRSHAAALGRYILVNAGQVMIEREPYSKIGQTHCL